MKNLNEDALELAKDQAQLAYNDTEGDLERAVAEAIAIYVEEVGSELVEKVRAMRAAQKQYFKTRDVGVLNQSKQLEREVDALLAKMEAGQGEMQI